MAMWAEVVDRKEKRVVVATSTLLARVKAFIGDKEKSERVRERVGFCGWVG